MTDRFFGYGSLVNRATQGYPGARTATLQGWTRVWVTTAQRPLAFLSVQPASQTDIEGLLAEVPGGDWAALDLREAAYLRHPVTVHTPAAQTAQVYAVPHSSSTERHPILLSYLDAVVQGFLNEYGAAGAARFFATTLGWDAGILDDRAAPLYPRAQTLSRAETGVVDAALMRLLA